MTRNANGPRPPRPPAGDPRLRVLLFLIAGAVLLHATFNRGPDPQDVVDLVGAKIKANQASYRPSKTNVTLEHAASEASRRQSTIAIAATSAVAVSDLSAPGVYNCAVGYSVTNSSARDISSLLFEVAYSSGEGRGASVASISVPASSTQGVTPAKGVRGSCDGVTAQVAVHACRYTDGADCRGDTDIIKGGAIILARAP